MNKTQLLEEMKSHGACTEATAFVQSHTSDSAKEIGLSCGRADWLVWFLARQRTEAVIKFSFSCADRAVRQHAPKALRAAGLVSKAEKLEALEEMSHVTAAAHAYAADGAYAAAATATATAAHAARAHAYAAAYAATAAHAAHATDGARAAAAAHSADADAADAAEKQTQLNDLHTIWATVHA